MKLLSRRKSTQAWIQDFQDKATDSALVRNAIALGVPENDVEIVEVTDEEFVQIVEAETASARLAAQEAEATALTQLRTQARAILTKLGLTKAEMKVLMRVIKTLSEADIDSL